MSNGEIGDEVQVRDGGAVAPADLRVSDRERDAVVTRLQVAFAEGRLDDEEFDSRVRAALGAKTRGELDRFTADLPADAPLSSADASAGSALAPVQSQPQPGSVSIAYKNSLRRGGRWIVPPKFTAVSYKGGGTVIDLRAAQLISPVTTIRAVAYKCRVLILVPPGMRVAVSGVGVTNTEEVMNGSWSADAPIVHVRGVAYKGVVEVRTTPDAPPARGELAP